MTGSSRENWPDDETLVAYADGALAREEAEKVELFLADNPDARNFVDLLRTSGNIANSAFDEALNVPRSDAKLAEMILASGNVEKTSQATNVVSLPRRQRPVAATQYAVPIAAAIALIIGGISGYEFGRRGPGGEPVAGADVAVGQVARGSLLASLLDEKPSGESVSVDGAIKKELMVVASFRDAKGRVCREFEVLTPQAGGPVTAGVACRNEIGSWHIEGAAQLAAAPEPSPQDFSPAGGNDAAAIEGILKAIGAKPALSKADEDVLLQKKWQ